MIQRLPRPLPVSLLLIGLMAGSQASADDTVNAQALVEQNCTSCHGSEVYTRSDRRVDSLDALHSQVRMCEQNLGLTWFDDQVDAVSALLNREYYRFEP
jgi:mono/diheme cytochrome c family protein